jgi:hypothetical protein
MKTLRWALAVFGLLHASCTLASGQIMFSGEQPAAAANGAPFFGFVRDAAGKAVPQARVTLDSTQAKTRVVLQSDRLGHFYFDGFREEINAQQVEVACAKPGYRMVKQSFRPPRGKPSAKSPIEVLCTLELVTAE